MPTQHALATCIESASIVIVVITIHHKQLHAFRLALQIAEVVLIGEITITNYCVCNCNHYVVITFGFSITTTLLNIQIWMLGIIQERFVKASTSIN